MKKFIQEFKAFAMRGNYTMELYYQYKNGHNKGPSQIETFTIQKGSLF